MQKIFEIFAMYSSEICYGIGIGLFTLAILIQLMDKNKQQEIIDLMNKESIEENKVISFQNAIKTSDEGVVAKEILHNVPKLVYANKPKGRYHIRDRTRIVDISQVIQFKHRSRVREPSYANHEKTTCKVIVFKYRQRPRIREPDLIAPNWCNLNYGS